MPPADHINQNAPKKTKTFWGRLRDLEIVDGLPQTAHGRRTLSLLRSHPDEVRLPSVAAEAVHQRLVYPAKREKDFSN